jgi:RHS repeat-associated protein
MQYGSGAGPHALTYAAGCYYNYDANGNMIKGRNKEMAYDPENRLIKVTEGSKITEFTYDGDGGRVEKTVSFPSTVSSSGSSSSVSFPRKRESTRYIGSLYEIEEVEDRLGAITTTATKHIFAGINMVCSLKSDGTAAYIHSDHLGSSNVISDENGVRIAAYEYQPYGKVSKLWGEDVTDYKFTGKELDDTGLYYYGARYYDPEIGRFTQADTIVPKPFNPQSFNRYSYCLNNPLRYIDPSGHEPGEHEPNIVERVIDFVGDIIENVWNAITDIVDNIWDSVFGGRDGPETNTTSNAFATSSSSTDAVMLSSTSNTNANSITTVLDDNIEYWQVSREPWERKTRRIPASRAADVGWPVPESTIIDKTIGGMFWQGEGEPWTQGWEWTPVSNDPPDESLVTGFFSHTMINWRNQITYEQYGKDFFGETRYKKWVFKGDKWTTTQVPVAGYEYNPYDNYPPEPAYPTN